MAEISKNNLNLIWQLVKRDIESRYRGSALGLLWAMISPLVMLGVYTFVFSIVFKLRWNNPGMIDSTQNFAITLFSGLILHQFLADVIMRAPSLMQVNIQLVKKVVFPLHILIPVVVLSSVFQLLISLLILLCANWFVAGNISPLIAALPIILMPFIVLSIGLGWILCALGVYLRDIGHFISLLVTILLFMSTIFYSSSALPEVVQPYIYLNPLSYIVDILRDLIFSNKLPDPIVFLGYSAVAIVVFLIGNISFKKLKKGFSDVL